MPVHRIEDRRILGMLRQVVKCLCSVDRSNADSPVRMVSYRSVHACRQNGIPPLSPSSVASPGRRCAAPYRAGSGRSVDSPARRQFRHRRALAATDTTPSHGPLPTARSPARPAGRRQHICDSEAGEHTDRLRNENSLGQLKHRDGRWWLRWCANRDRCLVNCHRDSRTGSRLHQHVTNLHLDNSLPR